MSEATKQYCPRAVENGGGPGSPFQPPFSGEMRWREDNTCPYCGSFNPEALMARLEAGDIELVPTDKSYKVYVRNVGGEPFKRTFRDCQHDSKCTGPGDCTHWTTLTSDETKFYFQHLSPEQQRRFIELYNDRKLKLGFPGHFYVTPFFCQRVPKAED